MEQLEQTKALNALEPFLALSKSATAPRAAADLVTQATSYPTTFVFAELLQTPQIQALARSPEHAPYLRLLEIFAYRTYTDYAASAADLPPLNDAQRQKLRQLSVLSLAPRGDGGGGGGLSYDALRRQLDLPDARAVEDLVISAVYAGLVEAQLDPHAAVVRVSAVSPLRDLAPGSVPAMLESLRAWSRRCSESLADLEAQIAAVQSEAARRHADGQAWAAAQARLVEEEKQRSLAEGSSSAQAASAAASAAALGGGVHGPRQSAALSRAMGRMPYAGQRFNKRGSDSLVPGPDDDDEAMDVDEEEPDEFGEGSGGAALRGPSKKRASQRKL
ncbi:PCI domain-containing protein [Xylariaceae sp. FL0804]|nr:PCI domain-containing protein [Xylariaceae sp. FL0804]